jgi:hypothetical protein
MHGQVKVEDVVDVDKHRNFIFNAIDTTLGLKFCSLLESSSIIIS